MFVTPAYAQAAGGAAQGAFGGLLVPMLLVFGIMYFFLIRPQQKKLKETEAMQAALRRGDKVLTQGGLIARVTRAKDEGEVELEIADGVKVRVARSAVVSVLSKTEPAKAAKD